MPRIYMAIAQEDRFPIADILRQTPDIPDNCQWALFLRNHDELTLEMVTDAERDYLWSTYASDPRARINLGIRRRLAPLMDNDRRKIELMNSLLFSMPGTPIIYYGDEIGMGDNIYLGDRNGVRTPMQWTPDRNAGFSRADPAKLYAPVIMDPVYGYQAVNVEAQSRSISSLLSWTKRLIAVRKASRVLGRGTLTFVRPANRAVLAYLRQYGGETILCVANLSRSAQAAELDLREFRGYVPQEMLGRARFPTLKDAPFMVTLAPYGFFWFQLIREDLDHIEAPSTVPELATIVIKDGWNELLQGRSRFIFERDVLPAFLPGRRWFAERGTRWVDARLGGAIVLGDQGGPDVLWTMVLAGGEGEQARYALPLRVNWSRFDRSAHKHESTVLAPVRRGPQEGVLIDAADDRAFVSWLLERMREGATVEREGITLQFWPSKTLSREPAPVEEVAIVASDEPSTLVRVDHQYVVKHFRRLRAGINPEVEVGRFLTDIAGYENTPQFAGSAELRKGDEEFTLVLVQRFVGNQGDGWSATAAFLDRYLDEYLLLPPDAVPDPGHHAGSLLRVQELAQRVAGLHRALASGASDSAFSPEPVSAADMRDWTDALTAQVEDGLDRLTRRRAQWPEPARALADELLDRKEALLARIAGLLPPELDVLKIRHHGNFSLDKILIVKDDVFIIGLGGDPERSFEERRRKAPALRDVASLFVSIDDATAAAIDRREPLSPEERLRLSAVLAEWCGRCADTFYGTYRDEVAGSGLWPTDPEHADRLRAFFMIEAAVSELGQAFGARPVPLPLAAIRRLIGLSESETRPEV
jgi:maltose alpha-D-glucosyltransferase/alpha-amylase